MDVKIFAWTTGYYVSRKTRIVKLLHSNDRDIRRYSFHRECIEIQDIGLK